MTNTVVTNRVLLLLLAAVAAPPGTAQLFRECATLHPYDYDSGETPGPAYAAIAHEGTPWIQLDLSGTELAGGARLVLRTPVAGDDDDSAATDDDDMGVAVYLEARASRASRDEGEEGAEAIEATGGGVVQELDAAGLAASGGHYTAAFDGDSVTVELVPGDNGLRGGASTSRLVVSGLVVGICKDDGVQESICGRECGIRTTRERARPR